jgi:glutathione S-transferase
MNNSINIYSFPLSGHAHRVELFAGLSGIAHQVINVDLAAGEHKQATFLAINPTGQVPAIQDGDVTITDSNAILVYLAKKYAPEFLPQNPVTQAEIQKFLTLAAGEIAFGPAAVRLINVFKAPLDVDFAKSTAENVFSKLEAHLEGREFLVAEKPTIADVAIYSYTAHAPEGGVSLDSYPNIRRLLTNIENLKGFVPMQSTKVGLLA